MSAEAIEMTMDAFGSVIGLTWALLLGLFAWNCTTVMARREVIIKELLDQSIYDNRIPPNYEDDYPTSVAIQIFLLSFDSVTEASMVTYEGSDSRGLPYNSPQSRDAVADSNTPPRFEYSVTIFLRESWVDRRLDWKDKVLVSASCEQGDNVSTTMCSEQSTANNHDGRGTITEPDSDTSEGAMYDEVLDRLEVDSKLLDLIWMPDLYFVNDKEAKIHDVTMANRMLHIYRNGSIYTSTRISMTLSCDMYLGRYPHDEQTCSMYLASYSFSAENVIFNWHDKPIIIREGITLPRFQVQLSETSEACNFKFGQGSMIMGNYTCIRADFKLRREYGYYIAQVYVPSCLIVMLSWVSFWIDLDAIPARVSLGLLTVLTMTTQSTGEKASLPKVSYVKAIDVWMAGCLVFVFAALLEFAYVNVQSRVEKRQQSIRERGSAESSASRNNSAHAARGFGPSTSNQLAKAVEEREVEVTINREHVLRRRFFRTNFTGVQRARTADKISRACFPLAFFLFNLIYWMVFVAAPF